MLGKAPFAGPPDERDERVEDRAYVEIGRTHALARQLIHGRLNRGIEHFADRNLGFESIHAGQTGDWCQGVVTGHAASRIDGFWETKSCPCNATRLLRAGAHPGSSSTG